MVFTPRPAQNTRTKNTLTPLKKHQRAYITRIIRMINLFSSLYNSPPFLFRAHPFKNTRSKTPLSLYYARNKERVFIELRHDLK